MNSTLPSERVAKSPEELSRQAWAYLDEFMDSGEITLPKGGGQDGLSPKILRPDKEDPTCKVIVDTCRWLGQLQGKPKKTPKAMDNWKPPETKA